LVVGIGMAVMSTVIEIPQAPIFLAIGVAVAVFSIQPLASGVFYRSAGDALRSVVNTRGNDIPYMLAAVEKLTTAFKVEAIAAILTLLIGVVAGVAVHSAQHG